MYTLGLVLGQMFSYVESKISSDVDTENDQI